jgi:asparagine synthase (glutamine-hydrolysing)
VFRYIALAWDNRIAAHRASALRLSLAVRNYDGWQPALLRPGLHVYTVGTRRGINGVYPFPSDQGVVLGRLFRGSELGGSSATDVQLSPDDAEQIVRTEGQALVRDYWGRYVAFLPSASGGTQVLRDPSGTLPCWRLERDGVGLAFSWLEDILQTLPDIPLPAVDWDGVVAHILFGHLGGRATALEAIQQVPPGASAPLAPGFGRPTLLWNAVEFAREGARKELPRAADRLRHTVRACAQAWAACYDPILLRLSGGLDSAILLSCMDRNDADSRITCLNYHSPGSDSDERSYARLAAGQAGRHLIERQRSPDFRLEEVLDVAHMPVPGSYVGRMGTSRMDAEVAAALGAVAMFTGGGGDQLFFELRSTWPAADYLRTRGLDRGFLNAALDAARLGRVSVWNAIGRAVADALHPTDPRNESGRHLMLAHREALDALQQRERFVHPALHAVHRLPIGKLHQVHDLSCAFDYYDPYQRQAAPELVNPLLSQPLMELCLALPTFVLTRGGRGRALARQAFADDIPAQIAGRRSKGGMEEHISTVLQRNLEFARSLLLDGQLVRQGLLDRARLEASLSGRISPQAAHVGEVHNCIAIEAWLQRWCAQPRTRPA